MKTAIRVIEWQGTSLALLDQRKLPLTEEYVVCQSLIDVADAITKMVVRGAPAIGITAAYGVALAAKRQVEIGHQLSAQFFADVFETLGKTRPTAVNLFWALARMREVAERCERLPLEEQVERLELESLEIHREDQNMCDRMGRFGAELLGASCRILTHCNTGALATGGSGTALAVIRQAFALGKLEHVYADETRPFLQGSRLTAWELDRDQIPVTVITDSMAGDLMRRGQIDAVIVGTDRITANGDVANKIGTYSLAVLASAHDIPFYVVGPTSTVDLGTQSGEHIEIEQRSSREVTHVGASQIVPTGVAVANPAFDVTPARLVSAIITEHGVIAEPLAVGLKQHVALSR